MLSILKDDALRDPDRHREIEKLLTRLSSETFTKFVSIGKCITDFSSSADSDADKKVKFPTRNNTTVNSIISLFCHCNV